MKHPVLSRTIIYGIILGLCGFIALLMHTFSEAPYTSRNMRSAYYDGCNFGGPRPLTDEHIAKCASIADLYKETLDDLDRQMGDLYDKEVF